MTPLKTASGTATNRKSAHDQPVARQIRTIRPLR